MPLYSGTIAIGAVRPSFAVLAADRFSHREDADGSTLYREHSKIQVHPTMPLALVQTGYGNFFGPSGQETHTSDILAGVLSRISRLNDLSPQSVHHRLEAALKRRVRDRQRTQNRLLHPIKDRVTVYIASFYGGRAELAQSEISGQTAFTLVSPDVALAAAPQTVGEYYTELGLEQLTGPGIEDPDELAAYVRKLVEDGIEHERLTNGGENRECGGPVDVVIVDATGVRSDR